MERCFNTTLLRNWMPREGGYANKGQGKGWKVQTKREKNWSRYKDVERTGENTLPQGRKLKQEFC